MTHYDVLGVADGASLDEVKRSYYERARMYHPDAHASSSAAVRAEAERTMQSLNSAWSVLRDPSRRRRYDRALARAAAGDLEPDGAGVPGPRWVADRSGAASAAGRGGRRAAAGTTPERRPRIEIGAGFQSWIPGLPGRLAGARRGLNLRLTGTSLAPLKALVPDGLVGLHASGTVVDDAELRNLQAMRSLRYLDLADTRVTDAGLVHLLGCTDLEVVSLWDTAVTDDGLALLGRLPNLCQLGLGNTAVTDAGLRHLSGLRRLRLVQLTGTAVAGPGLRHLHGLPELASVTLPWKVGPLHRRRLREALPRAAVLA
ncbi:MAG TPA: DnaJ domain-containing protein [Acidimicrobiales bacterium]|nr:DnaJ domain-containing protein [Acidimicrobiales bacterium]